MAEPRGSPSPITISDVYATLRQAYAPVCGVNVVEFGLVVEVQISADGQVVVDLLAPFEDAGLLADLVAQVAAALQRLPGFGGGGVRFRADRDWDTTMISPSARAVLGLQGI